MMEVCCYLGRAPLHLDLSSPDQDYLPPRASLVTSSVDHPKKTKPAKVSIHTLQQKVFTQNQKQEVSTQTPVTTIARKQDENKLITTKEQILEHYPDVFEGIGKFCGPSYSMQLDPSIPLNKHLAAQYQFT